MQLPAIVPIPTSQEAFTQATAKAYSWVDSSAMAAWPTPKLNQVSSSNNLSAIELSREQLTQQVHLVQDGLLGRGATALVFKCVWPSRHGRTLLAAKVLKVCCIVTAYPPTWTVQTTEHIMFLCNVTGWLRAGHAGAAVLQLRGQRTGVHQVRVCCVRELLTHKLRANG
jgi:hypothetical protein